MAGGGREFSWVLGHTIVYRHVQAIGIILHARMIGQSREHAPMNIKFHSLSI